MSVNDWMKRFTEQGVNGLKVAKGRGRPSILQTEKDLEAVRRAVDLPRQRISLAKADLEKELGKEFSHLTLKRFLKKTVALAHTCAIQTASAGNQQKAQPRRVRLEA